MLVLAVTLHNIPEGMAVGVVLAGMLEGSAVITTAGALALSIVVLAAGVLAVLCAPKPAVQTVSAAQAFSSDLR